MPLEVNPAAVQRSNVPLPREISRPSVREKSAEVIVVEETSRSANQRSNHPMKDRTDEEGFDPAADAPADDAGRRGMDESRRGRSRSAAETARRATMETLKQES